MLEWTIPLLIKQMNGRCNWSWIKINGGGNKYEVIATYRASHPEVVGYDAGQAYSRWL